MFIIFITLCPGRLPQCGVRVGTFPWDLKAALFQGCTWCAGFECSGLKASNQALQKTVGTLFDVFIVFRALDPSSSALCVVQDLNLFAARGFPAARLELVGLHQCQYTSAACAKGGTVFVWMSAFQNAFARRDRTRIGCARPAGLLSAALCQGARKCPLLLHFQSGSVWSCQSLRPSCSTSPCSI
jgi:hypothetical protein